MYVFVCVCVCVYIYMCVCMYVHTYIYIYIYTHKYVQFHQIIVQELQYYLQHLIPVCENSGVSKTKSISLTLYFHLLQALS
jgi:hypothetical protein